MWTLIIIFGLSLIAVLGMLFYRAWQIESGKVDMPESHTGRMLIPDMTFASLKKNVIYYSRQGLHGTIMVAMHAWVRGSHAVGKQAKKIGDKLVKKSPVDGTVEKTPISSFLVTMSDYKKKAKRLRERIRREDSVNPEEEKF